MHYIDYVKSFFFLANNLGMQIEDGDFSKVKYLTNKQKIQNYFRENKELKLIIVIIPEYLSGFRDIYSKYIVVSIFVFFKFLNKSV